MKLIFPGSLNVLPVGASVERLLASEGELKPQPLFVNLIWMSLSETDAVLVIVAVVGAVLLLQALR